MKCKGFTCDMAAGIVGSKAGKMLKRVQHDAEAESRSYSLIRHSELVSESYERRTNSKRKKVAFTIAEADSVIARTSKARTRQSWQGFTKIATVAAYGRSFAMTEYKNFFN